MVPLAERGLQFADDHVFHNYILLSGDSHLTTNHGPVRSGLVELTTNVLVGWTGKVHNGTGFVLMGDGSVQHANAPRLSEFLRRTGEATNRLAVP